MTLCTPCATIGGRVIHAMRMTGRNWTRWEIKNSTEMRESASNGCEGCEFFLAAIKQFSDTYQLLGSFEDFVTGAEPIDFVTRAGSHSLETTIADRVYCIAIELCAADQNVSDMHREGMRLIPQDPNEPEVLDLARLWLARCCQHDHCEAQEDTPLPTRLIAVPVDPELPLRIYATQQDSRGKYVALSHCWGRKVPFTTNSHNIESLIEGFCTETLPWSFRDAVTLTRELGFTYLWIDALCIIQDSTEDWARESAAMTRVYQNATLMISATASPDSCYGIFRQRGILKSYRFGFGYDYLWQSPSTSECLSQLSVAPLERRAWSYQEKAMAKRILYFSEHQMIWACTECVYTESMGVTPVNNLRVNLDHLRARNDLHTLMRHESPDLDVASETWSRLHHWYKCVEDYSSRDLTYPSDKLPALSGLAHGLRIPRLGQYLAGLWEVDLFRGLSWIYFDGYREDRLSVREYPGCVAPSWSCMSAAERVTFSHSHGSGLQGNYLLGGVHEPRLISHDIELETSDPHGRIKNGCILIRAYCRQIFVHTSYPPRDITSYLTEVWFDKRKGTFPWKFDAIDGYDWPESAHGPLAKGFVRGGQQSYVDSGGVGEIEEYIAVKIYQTRERLHLLILSPIDQNDRKLYKREGMLVVLLADIQTNDEKWRSQDLRII